MNFVLGIDTGGTYTDAVIINETSKEVLSKAKALTTHQHLELGIVAALENVLSNAAIQPNQLSLVSVSTTLATNAVVEGVNKRICAVLIGLDKAKAINQTLTSSLISDQTLHLSGGHNGTGEAQEALNLEPLESFLKSDTMSVSGFAITGYFSVRNPEHELAAKALIERYSDIPVTCSHHLASELDAPKRALTTILNARLIGLLSEFIKAIESALKRFFIVAPLMIVKGDGSLISAAEAKFRPIETIYSGPAASLVGACYLANLNDAIISDIGGTTTDIAILKNGLPKLNPKGVRIGTWQTMVKAVDMSTFGLGGDSEISLAHDGLTANLLLGPKRVIPLSLLAHNAPDLVHQTLELQISSEPWQENFGYFAVPLSNTLEGLDEAEKKFLESLTGQPKALFNLIQRRRDKLILKRLVALKRLALSAFTPSDAAHVLGVHNAWDVTAARKGAELFARQKNKKGQRIAADAASLSNWVHKTVSEHSSELILEAVLAEDGYKAGLSKHPLLTAALDTKPGFLRLGLSLSAPIVGLGASAKLYYPNVGKRLATQTIIPEHAEVANAVGAVMGLVRTEVSLLISQPQEGCFRVHHPEKPSDFSDLEQAFVFTEETAKRLATQKAKQAGAKDIELKLEKRIKRPQLDNESMFLEAQIVVTAFGRPGF